MYPFFRMAVALLRAKCQKKLTNLDEIYYSYHRIMPWDLDIFGELNNGITLSILDLNRLPYGLRVGLTHALAKHKLSMTMAGVSVRYQKRLLAFMRVEISCVAEGRDDKFFYLTQTIRHKGVVTTQALYRVAIIDNKGLIDPEILLDHMGYAKWRPRLKPWIENWIKAEKTRPWPPT